MKSFENNLKDRFNKASSLEGINADELWDNIEPIISDDSNKRRPFFFWFRYLFLFLFLFITIGGITWYQTKNKTNSNLQIVNLDSKNQELDNSNSNSNQIKTEQSLTKQSNTEESNKLKKDLSNSKKDITSNSLKENTTTSYPKNLNLEKRQSKNKIINTVEENLRIDNKSNTKSNVENNLKTDATPLNSSKVDIPNVLNEVKDKNSVDVENKSTIDLSKKTGEDSKSTSSNIAQNYAVQEIEPLPIILLKNENNQDLNRSINIPDFNKKTKFTLGAYVGGHTVKNIFSTKSATDKPRSELLNNGHQLELGYSFSVEASYRFYKNIFIATGIEYTHSKSEFNLIQTWDTIIVNPNSPVGAPVDAKVKRTVKHHNKLNYLSVPILLGFQKSFGKIDFGTSTGIGLNFTSSQSGKSVNFNNTVAIYPDTENNLLPTPSFFLSYHLRPYININIDKTLSFQIRSDIRYQNLRHSAFHNLNQSTIFFGLGAGFQYKF